MLSALFVYFVGRYLLLGRRAQDLAARYREFGASEQVLRVSFAEFPEVWRSRRHTDLATWLVLALSLVPGILMAVSLQRISSSPDLLKDGPAWLYKAAVIFYVLACVALVVASLGPAPKSLQRLVRDRAEISTGKSLRDRESTDR
jgi:hypothetical protein